MVAEWEKLKVCEVEQRKLMVVRQAEEVGSLRRAGGLMGYKVERGKLMVARSSGEVDGIWRPSGGSGRYTMSSGGS